MQLDVTKILEHITGIVNHETETLRDNFFKFPTGGHNDSRGVSLFWRLARYNLRPRLACGTADLFGPLLVLLRPKLYVERRVAGWHWRLL